MEGSVQSLSNWNAIFQAFIAPAVVAAIISVIVNSYLENRSDLRKRKIEAYTEFLDQINKFYPYDIKLYSLHRLKHSFAQEITKLEKYVWRIHVLGTYEVVGQAHELQSCFIHTLSLSQKGEHDEATK